MKVKSIVAVTAMLVAGVLTSGCTKDSEPAPTPASVAQSLLDADRAFALAAQQSGWHSTFNGMFAANVRMPTPPNGFAEGKEAVIQALQRILTRPDIRIAWKPIRVGVSADGLHGFSYGYLSQPADSSLGGGSSTPLKYMAYWVHTASGWQVVAYKRGRALQGPTDTTMMPAALPAQLVGENAQSNDDATRVAELMANEQAFSDDAQRVGLGNAFVTFGSVDAVNMGGGATAQFIVGADSIAAAVSGGEMGTSSVTWSASSALVASSGDLGITFGEIHVKSALPNTPGIPFFTIWRRAKVGDAWRYIAE